MYETQKLSAWYSWPSIIFFIILFWPLGLFLLYKRTTSDKVAALSTGKLPRVLGIVFYCFAALGILACVDEGFQPSDIVMIIIFASAGVSLRLTGKKIKNNAENIKLYLSVIVNGNVTSIDQIASSVGKPYAIVTRELRVLIAKGYLKNAYINDGAREIILPDRSTVSNSSSGSVTAAQTTRIVTCPCCGANNTISGDLGECEYCGSPVK